VSTRVFPDPGPARIWRGTSGGEVTAAVSDDGALFTFELRGVEGLEVGICDEVDVLAVMVRHS
jgi:hypothetical protein